jgi:hypothetical protein
MFDRDRFVADCTASLGESDSQGAIHDHLARAVLEGVALALRPSSCSAWEMASSDLSVGDRDAGAVPAGRYVL